MTCLTQLQSKWFSRKGPDAEVRSVIESIADIAHWLHVIQLFLSQLVTWTSKMKFNFLLLNHQVNKCVLLKLVTGGWHLSILVFFLSKQILSSYILTTEFISKCLLDAPLMQLTCCSESIPPSHIRKSEVPKEKQWFVHM